MPRKRNLTVAEWGDLHIAPGETKDFTLAVSESYSGQDIEIPLQVRRGLSEGPTVFVSGALHGDELNGTGTIRHLIKDESLEIVSGSLILIPVMNILAFERHSRYLPDRRDLNRHFPGLKEGSLASRMAKTLFDEIVGRSNFGIDLHTAAVRRTNYPTVRADMDNEGTAMLAAAFGGEYVVHSKGPKGSLRKEATKAKCPTIIMEGGEVWKVEPAIVECGELGVKRVLSKLNMICDKFEPLNKQIVITKTKWVRAKNGGFLEFHVQPGQVVKKKQPLATSTGLLGEISSTLMSPFDGVVIGMTTLPVLSPGEPVCHIGEISEGEMLSKPTRPDIVDDLASNVLVEPYSES